MVIHQIPTINSYTGDYAFLSNNYPLPLEFDTLVFPTATHMYECSKSVKPEDWKLILQDPNPLYARSTGLIITIRSDWPEIQRSMLRQVIHEKFTQHSEYIWHLWKTRHYVLNDPLEDPIFNEVLTEYRDTSLKGGSQP